MNPSLISVVASIALGLAHMVQPMLAAESAGEIDFNRDIRPLLSNNCFQCHGPDSNHREADLRLDIESAAKESAITAGDLQSEIILRITSHDEDEVMPPADSGKTLSSAEIELLKRWVKQGAKWQQHWAYVSPVQHPIPKVTEKDAELVEQDHGNWIDNFVLHRLRREGLSPAKLADRVSLVRRVYFDLTGLPPTMEQANAFVQDASHKSYEALVDRLLNSPHFGERLAIYWLDLVRYADTVGYHGDQDQNISPYRDYVIDAFNRNVPFDQFTREQLAGDLFENPTIDQQVATGYNRMLQTSHEGGVQPKEYLAIYQADRVRNVSAVWMGGTLGCAQCHDHKYDPYTAKDFYSMAAFFADIDEEQHFKKGTNSLPTARPPEIDVLNRREREQFELVAAEIEKLERESTAAGCDEERLAELKEAKKQIDKRRRRTMVTVALEKPRTVRLLPRGNWLDETGEVLTPSVPEFMGKIQIDGRANTEANRLDLANWLVDPKKGSGLLTARVMANRFWYLLFGNGLSESLDDFGGQGKPPVHPELLDNLAIEFVAGGWDIKRLFKRMVMSRTYRQSSLSNEESTSTSPRRDPDNLLFARQSRYRLPAEMIRDAALTAGGMLVDEFGGPSVKPYQPIGYYRHLNFPKRRYAHHGDQRQWRRGVYVHWQRQFLHPMLRAFDAPSREECTAKRTRSNTPLAALVLLNDPTFIEAARGLASRVLIQNHDAQKHDAQKHDAQNHDARRDTERLRHAFQIVVSRQPNEAEVGTLAKLLQSSLKEYKQNPKAANALLAVGEKKIATSDPETLAAWTTVARAILNLNEANTRP